MLGILYIFCFSYPYIIPIRAAAINQRLTILMLINFNVTNAGGRVAANNAVVALLVYHEL